jgi:bidirectional [NiFe] hydrogenase diaphorase subunit
MEPSELSVIAERETAARKPIRFRCCVAAGCQSANSAGVKQALEQAVTAAGLGERAEVVGVGCLRLCSQGPLVQIDPGDDLYLRVTPEAAPSLVGAAQGGTATATKAERDHPFFAGQQSVVLENCGRIDPERIESAIAAGAYEALAHALHEMRPAEVVDWVTRSGLRGRGGAGFPTGVKWSVAAKSPGDRKFVICNADEGDPGAFKDRTVLESDPHRVLEGMAIAGYATGAREGYVYIRAEYPLAIRRLELALKQARRLGVLGSHVFDSPFAFDVQVRIGAGAFVCGEETALIHSIEGLRGTPRPRPPYPGVSGLWECPTLINNVETFSNIAPILRRGPEWYAAIGSGKSRGTKVFSLAGKVRYTGLVEVPMGTSIRRIVEVMGGGTPGGGPVKAVQTGGPSGGFVPERLLDTPVDYEEMAAIGSIVGSGGMIVLDEKDDMVDVARFFMDFCRDESCGKCIPCRVGTVQMHGMLDRLVKGEGTQADVTRLEGLADMVKHASLCGLGQSAPNPVLSSLKHFRHEYDAKLKQGGQHGR